MDHQLYEKIANHYPTPIAQNFCKTFTGSLQEQINYACNCLEATIQYAGSVAIAIYRDSSVNHKSLDHFIFLALERPFYGIWLRILQQVGEYLEYTTDKNLPFAPWIKFLRDFALNERLYEQVSELLQFRNDIRHGSTSLTLPVFEKFHNQLQKFLRRFAFYGDYLLYGSDGNGRYLFCGEKIIDNNLESKDFLVELYEKTSQATLELSPLLKTHNRELGFQTPGPKRDEIEEFYCAMKWQQRYKSFLEEAKGFITVSNIELPFCVKTTTTEAITNKIEQGAHKIILCGYPGAGKTYTIQHLQNSFVVCKYFIEGSFLRIQPTVALKALYCSLMEQLGEKITNLPDKTEALLKIIMEQIQRQNKKIIFAIDGLFSPSTPQSINTYYESWLSILNAEMPDNVVWLVTCVDKDQVPRFYDGVIEIELLKYDEIIAVCPQYQDEKYSDLVAGNPKVLLAYNNTLASDFPIGLWQYLDKLLYKLNITCGWKKDILKVLAQSDKALSVKEIAAKESLFTPKVERFLFSIMAILRKEAQGYHLYHPILAKYINKSRMRNNYDLV